MSRFFATDESMRSLFQRAALAALVFPHGAQKLLGWFGGYGFAGVFHWFTQDMGVPAPLAVLVILVESLGMIALAAGFLTRLVAAGFAATMVGAIVLVHGQFGFFMNWTGAQGGEGFQYHLALLALAVPLAITGGGAWSIDGVIARRLRSETPALATA
jgi:putative oxidoreductase